MTTQGVAGPTQVAEPIRELVSDLAEDDCAQSESQDELSQPQYTVQLPVSEVMALPGGRELLEKHGMVFRPVQ